jgi:hypothetical protein
MRFAAAPDVIDAELGRAKQKPLRPQVSKSVLAMPGVIRHPRTMEQTLSTDMLESLAASGPHPEHREDLMLFGQFIGSWDFDWTGYQPDGTTITARGEWHFGWVLEGRAVEDVWICPSRAERERGDTRQGEFGATLRVYDPSIGSWRCTWHGPSFGNHRIFMAGLRGDEIVLEGETPEGNPLHWTFSDIQPDSFRWRDEVSEDGGNTWRLQEEMDVKRRP